MAMRGVWGNALAFTLLAAVGRVTALGATATIPRSTPNTACRVASIEGEVRAGEAFEQRIGNGLKILLEPIASGWIVRVLPVRGPRGDHDYAELATPPYHSVSPLSISTDFSFRAQDALGWNPRYFRFAADRRAFEDLKRSYDDYQRSARNGAEWRAAEARLGELSAASSQGELDLLDAHLVQGTADQAGTAAMVALHLNASAHEVDQAANGRSTPLGRLNWIRFRLQLGLPPGFPVATGWTVRKTSCL